MTILGSYFSCKRIVAKDHIQYSESFSITGFSVFIYSMRSIPHNRSRGGGGGLGVGGGVVI